MLPISGKAGVPSSLMAPHAQLIAPDTVLWARLLQHSPMSYFPSRPKMKVMLSEGHGWQGWCIAKSLRPRAKCCNFPLHTRILPIHPTHRQHPTPPFTNTGFFLWPTWLPQTEKPNLCLLQTAYRCLPPFSFSHISVLGKEPALVLFRTGFPSSNTRTSTSISIYLFTFFLLFVVFSDCFVPLLSPMQCTPICLFTDQECSPQIFRVHFLQQAFRAASLKQNLPCATLILCFSPAPTGKELQ